MANRRLMKEQQSLLKDPLDFCTIETSDNDMYNWRVLMAGPSDSPYSGGMFLIKVEFPSQYPFKPPHLTFSTKIYHPSVETATGKICANLIADGWGPTLNVRHCLTVIYNMMVAPSADSPLEDEIAQMLRENPKEFEKQAKKFTKDYAQ